MNPAGYERLSARDSLTLLQTVNIFMILVCFARHIPDMVFWAAIGACAVALYLFNRRVFAGHQLPPAYAESFRSNVPEYREFPRVYNYLFFSFLLFAAPFVSIIAFAP
jgi:hypothetical protein